MSTTKARPQSRWTADEWNERFPVGTEVEYRATWGQPHVTLETRTRSEAWTLPHGEPIVLIEGRAGGVALWALTPLRYCSHCRTAFPVPEVTR